MVDAWKLADEIVASSHALIDVLAHDRITRIRTACDSACKEVLGTGETNLKGCYHDTYNRPIYKPMLENGNAQHINVKVGGDFLDISAISPLVASAASFNIHRVYYDQRIDGQGAELTARLKTALKKALN